MRSMSRHHDQHGFTLTELVIVMLIAGLLAAIAVPRMTATLNQADNAWRDSVQSGLRFAQKTAVSRRRLVCASVEAQRLVLTTDRVYQSALCDLALPGPDGRADPDGAQPFDRTSRSRTTWTGVLYFQPDGRVTTDKAGTAAANPEVTVQGANTIIVLGETGYVE